MENHNQYNLWYPDNLRLLSVLLVASLATFLLYEPIVPRSIPLTACYLTLLAALWPKRMNFLSRNARILWGIQLGLCGLGLFWAPGGYAAALALASLFCFRLLCREETADTAVGRWFLKVAVLLFSFPFEALYQIRQGSRNLNEAKGIVSRVIRGMLLWILPILGSLLFLAFFSEANPILERWVDACIERLKQIHFPSAGRCLFWCFCAAVTLAATGFSLWQKIYPEFLQNPVQGTFRELPDAASRMLAKIMTRGLLLFNLLFLVQNLLDVEYLWAGAKLPDGMSYAEYAHRGAYPLIVTALIAGFLTLLTFSGKCRAPEWKHARILVYLWLGQNVFLVASSLLRLGKYVAVYSLTHLRFAAALWMMLVGIGLCLILCKILREKSLRWLFWANGIQLLVLFLFVLFFDRSGFIAEYNFAHCREIAGPTKEGIEPAPLDRRYLVRLLPSSLPVLLRMRNAGIPLPETCSLHGEIRKLEESLGNWRTWNPEAFRLLRAVEHEDPGGRCRNFPLLRSGSADSFLKTGPPRFPRSGGRKEKSVKSDPFSGNSV